MTDEEYLPVDVPLPMSGIPPECDDRGCGCDPSVCPDSSPGLLAGPPEALIALKIHGGMPDVAVGTQRGKMDILVMFLNFVFKGGITQILLHSSHVSHTVRNLLLL